MAVMTKKTILTQLDSLSKDGLREVADFISFVKKRYQNEQGGEEIVII